MLLNYHKLFFTGLLFLLCCISKAQVVITFNAPVYGQSLEGLSYVQVLNSSTEDVTATATIRVREHSLGNVLTAIITGVTLRRGMNTLDRVSFSRGKFSFGNNYYGLTLSQSGKFPEGEYEYCFEVEITHSKTPWPNPYFENCFTQQLQPLTPLLLIHPADEDESCNTRPALLWQLPMPLPANARCRLVLTELKEDQDIAEAINYNIPIINQSNITGNQLLYPAGAPALKENKKYVWQVIVYTGPAILKRSEIWTYSIKCEPEKPLVSMDGYRDLREIPEGSFYVANKVLRFSFQNPYNEAPLQYTITSLSAPDKTIKDLPVLKMYPGLNKYDLDLADNNQFKNGEEYQVKVKLINNTELRLRFVYKNE